MFKMIRLEPSIKMLKLHYALSFLTSKFWLCCDFSFPCNKVFIQIIEFGVYWAYKIKNKKFEIEKYLKS